MKRRRGIVRPAAGTMYAACLVAGLLTLSGVNCGGNSAPLVPSVPSGLSSGYRNQQYQFTTLSEDPDDDLVSCQFDWGDSTCSEWSDFVPNDTPVAMSKNWTDTGAYAVRARARDENGNTSDWSAAHMMSIRDSTALPSVPIRPIGDTITFAFSQETYATLSTDPGNSMICYIFDWGDGAVDTTGLFNSGDTCAATHMWQQTGNYPVRALARTEDGRLSARWSDSLLVRVHPSRPVRR